MTLTNDQIRFLVAKLSEKYPNDIFDVHDNLYIVCGIKSPHLVFSIGPDLTCHFNNTNSFTKAQVLKLSEIYEYFLGERYVQFGVKWHES